ncbi:MAG: NAD(P)/FAD-dependent oxidoreductase [Planctomycetes bacterium]|nr:NAD(P)/FAD-dependent oxidoreductase [Planctomycetota bacterium]
MTESAEHWGVVGGGVLGLALARRLRQAGRRVTVLEAAPQLGGLAAAWELGGVTWDKHYHVILLSDSHVHRLLAGLGLSNEFVGVETKTGFFTDGRLYSMSNSLEFLRFPPLGLLNKLRLGATIFRASKIRDWKALERVPVVDWLTRWSGRRTVEKIWLPLLRSKLGDSYKIASAAFIWAIIARMYAARRSGLKKEMFGYVRGGYARILDRFARVLTESGVELRTGARVEAIEPAGDGARVVLADGESLAFDRVVCTAAAPIASKLIPALTESEHERLNGVRYQGIVCASVLLKNPLDRFYVTNITDGWVPFTAVIEMSALVDRSEFGGNCLVYLPKYVAPDDPIFEEADDSLRERFLAALERMYPHFRRDDVLDFRVSRVRQVFAVSTLNYSASVPPVPTALPGVYLVNSAQIVNGTLNVNETLQLAEQALPALLAPAMAPATV